MNWLKDNVQAIIGLMTVVFGFAYLFLYPDKNTAIVVGLMTFVLGYYFGTSVGSAKKDDILQGFPRKDEPSPRSIERN